MVDRQSCPNSGSANKKSTRAWYLRVAKRALVFIAFWLTIELPAEAQVTEECKAFANKTKIYVEDAAHFYKQNIVFSAGDEKKVIAIARKFYLGTYNVSERGAEAQAKSAVIQTVLHLSLNSQVAPEFEGGIDRICEDSKRLKAPLLAEACIHGRIHTGRLREAFGGAPNSFEAMEALFRFSADDPSLTMLKDLGRSKEEGEKIYNERISGMMQTIKLMLGCGNSTARDRRKQ